MAKLCHHSFLSFLSFSFLLFPHPPLFYLTFLILHKYKIQAGLQLLMKEDDLEFFLHLHPECNPSWDFSCANMPSLRGTKVLTQSFVLAGLYQLRSFPKPTCDFCAKILKISKEQRPQQRLLREKS